MAESETREISVVTFDVGGTLIEPYPSVGAVYAEVAREFGFECVPERITQQFGDAWLTRTNFGYSRREWFEVVEHSFRGHAPVSEELFSRVYERFCEAAAWRLFEDVLPAFEALEKAGMRLAAISNWDERLEPLLQKLGIHGRFEQVTVSGKLGRHKPDPEIFLQTTRALGVMPGAVLHVGDSLREDVEGARAAGLRAVRIRRKGKERSEDIEDLLELVQQVSY